MNAAKRCNLGSYARGHRMHGRSAVWFRAHSDTAVHDASVNVACSSSLYTAKSRIMVVATTARAPRTSTVLSIRQPLT